MDTINEQALKDLKKYRDEGCHMLIPAMQNITDVVAGFRLIVTATKISPHPKDGDVYPHDSKQYDAKSGRWKEKLTGEERVRFHAQGFQRLAQDANIMWSRPVFTIDPNFKNRIYCDIIGEIVLPDGFSKYRLPDGSGMDLDVELEALIQENSYNGVFDKKNQWKVDEGMIRKKKYQQKMVLTGAKNRVTERILGLKKTYTLAELEKPFVSVRVVYWPDMTDRFTRELFIKGKVAQMFISNIYGPSQDQEQQPAITYGAVPAEKCAQADDPSVVDADYHLDKSQTMAAPLPSDDEPPFASGPTPESLRLDFTNSDPDGQCRTLREMAGTRDLDGELKATGKTLEKCTPAYRLKLYDYLTGGKEKAA